MSQAQPSHAQDSPADKKVMLTISTLDGDYTHAFPPHQKLSVVVSQALEKLKISGDGPWILESKGQVLQQDQTIEQARLADGTVLTLNQQEGGGGSRRQ